MNTNELIRLEGVSRSFDGGRIVALNGVDLTIRPQECLALVGRSGSGKSCLLNLAAGLDMPDAGRVLWKGEAVTSSHQWARLRMASIGIVFQEFHLLPTLTAQQNVELALMGSSVRGADQTARARAMLERVGLSERLGSLPAELSGGERQRVAIARALVRGPEILFADEPTGNLDSVNAGRIMQLLLDLHEENRMGVVLVTHDEEQAARCARVVRMEDGRIADDIQAQGGGQG